VLPDLFSINFGGRANRGDNWGLGNLEARRKKTRDIPPRDPPPPKVSPNLPKPLSSSPLSFSPTYPVVISSQPPADQSSLSRRRASSSMFSKRNHPILVAWNHRDSALMNAF